MRTVSLLCALLLIGALAEQNLSKNAVNFLRLVGFNFNPNPLVYPSVSTWANYSTATIDACEAICNQGPGCDFYTFNSVSKVCDMKFADLVANMSTVFKGQTSGRIFGELRFANIINANPIVSPSADACINQCSAAAACQFVIFDDSVPTAVLCTMKFFDADATTTIGFRQNPRPLNYNPAVLGRIDVIGNSGIVCIFANLLPDGRILCAARPQYFQGGINYDNIMAPFPDPFEADGIHHVPFGEIASIFDPLTGIRKPSPVDDNIFCHGTVLAEDGTAFSAGGDDDNAPSNPQNGPIAGLVEGLNKMRWFDHRTEKWTYITNRMMATRWYPTVVRLVNGSYVIIGGLTSGTSFLPQRSLEFYNPNLPNSNNTLFFSEVLDFTGTSGYPKAYLIPGSGDVYIFAYNTFEVVSKTTGLLLERETWSSPDNGVTWVPYVLEGRRSGNFVAGNCLLPPHASRGYVAEIALFGGGDNLDSNMTARNDVARMIISAPAPKRWTIDTDRMPYGREVSDCTLQPNGKMILTNGGRMGFTGGLVGTPNLVAAANGTISNLSLSCMYSFHVHVLYSKCEPCVCCSCRRRLLLRSRSCAWKEVLRLGQHEYPTLLPLHDGTTSGRTHAHHGHRPSYVHSFDSLRAPSRGVHSSLAAERHSSAYHHPVRYKTRLVYMFELCSEMST